MQIVPGTSPKLLQDLYLNSLLSGRNMLRQGATGQEGKELRLCGRGATRVTRIPEVLRRQEAA